MERYDMSIAHGNIDTQTTRKITASSYRQDVTLMLNGIKTRRQPGGKFVSDVNTAHG